MKRSACSGIASTIGSALPVEDRDRELAAGDVALDQDPVVVAERADDRGRDRARVAGEADAERRALTGRLDDERQPEAGLDLLERIGGAELAEGGGAEGDPVRRRDADRTHPVLGLDLVHAEDAGADPGAGVGNPEQLEQRLDGPVLAARSMQGDEGDVGVLLLEPGDEPLVGVDRDDVVAECGDRLLHPRPRLQRHRRSSPRPPLRTATRTPAHSRSGFRWNGSTDARPGLAPAARAQRKRRGRPDPRAHRPVLPVIVS